MLFVERNSFSFPTVHMPNLDRSIQPRNSYSAFGTEVLGSTRTTMLASLK